MNIAQFTQDQYIKIGSINTRYWSVGKGSPVILLHGGGGFMEVWGYAAQSLAQHHRVLTFDMVGTGLTDKPVASYSLDYQARFLQGFLDALNIQQASFIGNSMGGSVALKFALQSPERVRKLGLVSSFGLGREIDVYDRLLATFPAIMNLIPPSRKIVKWVLHSCVYNPESIPEEWVELSFQRFSVPDQRKALISLLTANVHFWGVRREVFDPIVQQLECIKAPTLIVWGKQDSIVPISHAYVASRKIPNSSLHVFEQCEHWAQVEYPEAFNHLVSEFLI